MQPIPVLFRRFSLFPSDTLQFRLPPGLPDLDLLLGCWTTPLRLQFGSVGAESLSGRHPREYAALAYLLETAGHPVTGTYPTRFSEQEAAILEAGNAWLAEANVAQS